MLEFEDYEAWKARNVKRKAPENSVKKAGQQWLDVHKIIHNRQQSGKLQVINPHTRKPYWVQLASEGSGDEVGLTRKGRYFEIEWKSESGRQSPMQKYRQVEIEASGGIYILARSVEDLEVLLNV